MGHRDQKHTENVLWGRGRETSAFEMVLAPFPKVTPNINPQDNARHTLQTNGEH